MSSVLEIELKPCPFCGEKANIEINDTFFMGLEPKYMAMCTWCSGNSGWYETDEEATEAWNRRVHT